MIFNGNGAGGSDSFTYNLSPSKLGCSVTVVLATNVTVNENLSTAQTINIQQDTNDATKTDVISTLGDLVALANPGSAGSLTVNGGTGTGADTINVNSFGSGFSAALTIAAGASSGSSVINFGASLAPAAGNGLTLSADTINVTDDAAIALTGTGAASLTTVRNIYFDPGTGLSVVNGNLTISAHASATVGATFVGIDLNGATVQTSGTGNISLTGKSGNGGASNPGIRLRNGAVVESTSSTPGSAGTISMTATETTTGSVSGSGLCITDSGTEVTSQYGNITLAGTSGTGGSGTGANAGVLFSNSALIASTGTGGSAATITITGTSGATEFQTSTGMQQNYLASIQTVDGNISITAAGPTNGGNGGRSFYMPSGSIVSTGAGSITINGNSTVSSGNNRNGVEMDAGTSIISSGTGAVTLNGVWGSNNGTGAGLLLSGYIQAPTTR